MADLLTYGLLWFSTPTFYHFHEVFAILIWLKVLIFQGSEHFSMCELSVINIKEAYPLYAEPVRGLNRAFIIYIAYDRLYDKWKKRTKKTEDNPNISNNRYLARMQRRLRFR